MSTTPYLSLNKREVLIIIIINIFFKLYQVDKCEGREAQKFTPSIRVYVPLKKRVSRNVYLSGFSSVSKVWGLLDRRVKISPTFGYQLGPG
jgi:hypothetical protein